MDDKKKTVFTKYNFTKDELTQIGVSFGGADVNKDGVLDLSEFTKLFSFKVKVSVFYLSYFFINLFTSFICLFSHYLILFIILERGRCEGVV